MSEPFKHIPLPFERQSESQMIEEARRFCEHMNRRRSVRFFSNQAVPRACIEYAIRTANTAPSGAHKQPWTWVVIDRPDLKKQIREAAENEERISYEGGRMTEEWLQALAPLGTDWHKPFLEIAPYIVVCFRQNYGLRPDGRKETHYYVHESVGIACGLFIAAIHTMGLVTLTHTPSPMNFLSKLLNRPENEKPFILFPVGYPAEDATVPDLERKPLAKIIQWNDSTV
ncbi:nitroreductase family protein [bacterium]|nr:nitroreductase family protein [bacterium]NUN46522.1 nitroreductase family protein [bacterium]